MSFITIKIFLIYFMVISCQAFALPITTSRPEKDTLFSGRSTYTTSPQLSAVGDQIYCPQTSLPIVTAFTINDASDTATEAIYIQITAGFHKDQDLLSLSGNHPTVIAKWNSELGTLKISAPINGNRTPYTELIAAVKAVVYSNSSNKPSGNRVFSISTEPMAYLPSNGHFYEFIKAPGITWGDARITAETKNYFGIKGYLATILNAEEQQLVGEQLGGNGWIGGADFQREGEWRWITGPEAGTLFWSNLEVGPDGSRKPNIFGQGYTPNFMYWNRKNGTNNEPDNGSGFENFAHIIDNDPTLGIKSSWTDLTYEGTTNGPMKSRGFVVEYGGTTGDPLPSFVTSVKITIPQIETTKATYLCGGGSLTLEATSNLGTVYWYDSETGGSEIAIGNSFTTPLLNASKTYYVTPVVPTCLSPARTAITATIYPIPIITTSKTTFSICGPGEITMTVATSGGETYWYESPTDNRLIGIGTSLSRLVDTNKTFYVEAVLNTCTNGSRIPIYAVVYDLPPTTDVEIPLCKSSKVLLDAVIENSTYLWSTGETTKTIAVDKEGVYTVTITLPPPKNCILESTLTVTNHPNAIIKNIEIDEDKNVTIELVHPKSYYEFSLDNSNYQDAAVFQNVAAGIQTVYVREKKSCNPPIKENFIVIHFPKFFTPNADNYNDVLKIKGLEFYPSATITIFDRMGKFIHQLDYQNATWDGTFNGVNLPATDYWYVLKLDDSGVVKRGHFSLKR
jgi:gliding motility-associated-like protein